MAFEMRLLDVTARTMERQMVFFSSTVCQEVDDWHLDRHENLITKVHSSVRSEKQNGKFQYSINISKFDLKFIPIVQNFI